MIKIETNLLQVLPGRHDQKFLLPSFEDRYKSFAFEACAIRNDIERFLFFKSSACFVLVIMRESMPTGLKTEWRQEVLLRVVDETLRRRPMTLIRRLRRRWKIFSDIPSWLS